MKSRTKSIKQNLTLLQHTKPRKKSQSRTQKQKPSVNSQSSFVKPPLKSNKQGQEARKYLQKTLNILSHRFGIMTGDSHNINSVLQLSTSVYNIVKENLSVVKKCDNNNNKENLCLNINGGRAKIREEVMKDQDSKTYSKNNNSNNNNYDNNNRDSRKIIISQKQQIQKVRPASVMANYSSILQASSICHNQSAINCQPLVVLSDNSLFVKRRSNSTLDTYFREKFGTNAEDEEAVQKKLRVIKALKKSQEIVTKTNRSHIQSSVVLNSCDLNDKSIVMDKLRGKKEERLR